MEDKYCRKITDYAKSLAFFMSLQLEDRKRLEALLPTGIKRTIELIELIEDRPMTVDRIAIELNVTPQTVVQKINCLIDGGYQNISSDGYLVSSWLSDSSPKKLETITNNPRIKLKSSAKTIEQTAKLAINERKAS